MTAPAPRRRGFSLLELMFSMAIGSAILLLAATMLGSSGDSYERVGGNVASEREARAVITQLSADLATARFHKDVVIDSRTNGGWPADRIGFLTLQPAAAQTEEGRIGDLCAVNYYIKDLTIAGRTVRCLMRGFRDSKDTFAALRNKNVETLFQEQAALDEPVAFGVAGFQAIPRTKDAEGKWVAWVKNDATGPDALEVQLIVARRDLSAKLRNPSDWDGATAAGRLMGQPADARNNANLEVYGATLRFGNHELP